MRLHSVRDDAAEVRRAASLIELGARLQVLESETRLSRERLLKLYKEIRGKSPPKGMLPFSTDWFTTWLPNVHSSLFMAIYGNLIKATALDDVDAIVKAFRLYLEQCAVNEMIPELTMTRAWRLVRFVDAGMLRLAPCTSCAGRFVVRDYDLTRNFVCGLCNIPARAGRTKAAAARAQSDPSARLEKVAA
ncbi:MAG: flagellar transcriptional regulator FlhC [Betaproteobacteria bacterium]